MKAEIIAVGSELLTPDRVDTNSLFLTEELNKIGIEVVRKSIVGDHRDTLRAAFHEALQRVELVIASGGLGPTEDDLTRETVADLLGRKLQLNKAILQYIEGRFRQLGREMPPVNVRQAMVPEGAEVLENPRGSAPGLWIEAHVSGADFAAAGAARVWHSNVSPRAARCGHERIGDRAAHPADLHALRRREHYHPRRTGRNSDSFAHLDRRRRARSKNAG